MHMNVHVCVQVCFTESQKASPETSYPDSPQLEGQIPCSVQAVGVGFMLLATLRGPMDA